MSQWSTLESGPLARSETGEKGGKPGKSQEPVIHFGEWTTSWAGNREKGRKTGEKLGASGPLAQSEAEKSQAPHPTKKRPALPVAFDLFCR